MLKNTQPVLFKVYFEAGLRPVAQTIFKADGLLQSLISCHNFKRCHRFLLLAWEALFRYQLEEYFNFRASGNNIPTFDFQSVLNDVIDHIKDTHSHIDDTEQISSMRETFIKDLKTSGLYDYFLKFNNHMSLIDDSYKFWNNFVRRDCLSYVSLYIAIRSGNWSLRVASITILAPFYHAYNRTTYLKLVAHHLATLKTMPTYLLNHLCNGGFSATVTGNIFNELAFDECHLHTISSFLSAESS